MEYFPGIGPSASTSTMNQDIYKLRVVRHHRRGGKNSELRTQRTSHPRYTIRQNVTVYHHARRIDFSPHFSAPDESQDSSPGRKPGVVGARKTAPERGVRTMQVPFDGKQLRKIFH